MDRYMVVMRVRSRKEEYRIILCCYIGGFMRLKGAVSLLGVDVFHVCTDIC